MFSAILPDPYTNHSTRISRDLTDKRTWILPKRQGQENANSTTVRDLLRFIAYKL